MINAIRTELLAMRDEDQRVRQELLERGELEGPYVGQMEAVHLRNAARLQHIISELGWPDEQLAGTDGAEAAWLIVQHAIGLPKFQKACRRLMMRAADDGRVPRWQVAYLEDRIAMYEGRPQRHGSQWLEDLRDGRSRPWLLEDSQKVDQWRAEIGLPPLAPIPEPGPDLPPERQAEIRANQQWWLDWLASKGWGS